MIDGIPLIDFSVRPPIGGYEKAPMYTRLDRIRRRAEALAMPRTATIVDDVSLATAEREMKEAGVDGIVLHGQLHNQLGTTHDVEAQNDELIAYADSRPGAAWVLTAIDPNTKDWREHIERERAKSRAVRGVLLEPGLLENPLYPDDQACRALYDYCQEHNILVAIGIGGNSEPDCGYSMPVHFDRVARDFPRLRLLIIHAAWPWVLPAIHVAQRRPNVFLMPDSYVFMAGAEPYHQAMNGYLKHQFVFASGYPFMHLKDGVMRLRKLLSDEAAALFFSGNARRLLEP